MYIRCLRACAPSSARSGNDRKPSVEQSQRTAITIEQS